MITTDVKCPMCGKINHNLYLEETDGWMECERCGNLIKDIAYMKKVRLPVIQMRDESKLLCASGMLGEPA